MFQEPTTPLSESKDATAGEDGDEMQIDVGADAAVVQHVQPVSVGKVDDIPA